MTVPETGASPSSNEPRRSRLDRLFTDSVMRVLTVIAATMIIVAASLIIIVNTIALNRLRQHLATLDVEIGAKAEKQAAVNQEILKRMETLEHIVFGAWEALEDKIVENTKKLSPTSMPTQVQVWQKNRDLELRERIARMERELWRRDVALKRLEQQIREMRE
jgi:cell division protein FtsL